MYGWQGMCTNMSVHGFVNNAIVSTAKEVLLGKETGSDVTLSCLRSQKTDSVKFPWSS